MRTVKGLYARGGAAEADGVTIIRIIYLKAIEKAFYLKIRYGKVKTTDSVQPEGGILVAAAIVTPDTNIGWTVKASIAGKREKYGVVVHLAFEHHAVNSVNGHGILAGAPR